MRRCLLSSRGQIITLCCPMAHLPNLMESSILKPPAATGMKTLNRLVFKKIIKVPCLKLSGNRVEEIRHVFKPILLKMPHLKAIVPGEETKMLLNPIKISKWSDIEENAKIKLTDIGLAEADLTWTDLELNYENWNADEILRAILPPEVEIARGFSRIGHIIHLNLREHLLQFKHVIGQVVMDKIANIRTVVNKTTKIDNTYRNFQMELICGEDDMVTQVKENGISYEFDFSQVYWNPRLSTEHHRVVAELSAGDVLFDVFCGVGPFAIPCAKKKCLVLANDLNPHSFSWLNRNIKLNKVKEGFISTFNKDGSDFIKHEIKEYLVTLSKNEDFQGKTHVTMNLPALALNFVQYFKHLFSKTEVAEADLQRVAPKIHVYFFVSGSEPQETAKKEFEACTGLAFTGDDISYHFVRNVSTSKDMVKICFTPPMSYLLKQSEESLSDENLEPATKKVCSDLR